MCPNPYQLSTNQFAHPPSGISFSPRATPVSTLGTTARTATTGWWLRRSGGFPWRTMTVPSWSAAWSPCRASRLLCTATRRQSKPTRSSACPLPLASLVLPPRSESRPAELSAGGGSMHHACVVLQLAHVQHLWDWISAYFFSACSDLCPISMARDQCIAPVRCLKLCLTLALGAGSMHHACSLLEALLSLTKCRM